MQHINANVQFGHKQFENPSKIPIVVTVKAKGYSQLEYILHLFLKIIISAYYNYLQVSHFLVKLEPVFLLLPPWQVKPNWAAPTVGPTPASNSPKTHIFNHWHFLNQTSSRSSYQFDQEDIYSISLCWTIISGKVRFLLLQPDCHQKVTLVVSRYKVPPVRRMSRQKWIFLKNTCSCLRKKVKVGHEFTQNV